MSFAEIYERKLGKRVLPRLTKLCDQADLMCLCTKSTVQILRTFEFERVSSVHSSRGCIESVAWLDSSRVVVSTSEGWLEFFDIETSKRVFEIRAGDDGPSELKAVDSVVLLWTTKKLVVVSDLGVVLAEHKKNVDPKPSACLSSRLMGSRGNLFSFNLQHKFVGVSEKIAEMHSKLEQARAHARAVVDRFAPVCVLLTRFVDSIERDENGVSKRSEEKIQVSGSRLGESGRLRALHGIGDSSVFMVNLKKAVASSKSRVKSPLWEGMRCVEQCCRVLDEIPSAKSASFEKPLTKLYSGFRRVCEEYDNTVNSLQRFCELKNDSVDERTLELLGCESFESDVVRSTFNAVESNKISLRELSKRTSDEWKSLSPALSLGSLSVENSRALEATSCEWKDALGEFAVGVENDSVIVVRHPTKNVECRSAADARVLDVSCYGPDSLVVITSSNEERTLMLIEVAQLKSTLSQTPKKERAVAPFACADSFLACSFSRGMVAVFGEVSSGSNRVAVFDTSNDEGDDEDDDDDMSDS